MKLTHEALVLARRNFSYSMPLLLCILANGIESFYPKYYILPYNIIVEARVVCFSMPSIILDYYESKPLVVCIPRFLRCS